MAFLRNQLRAFVPSCLPLKKAHTAPDAKRRRLTMFNVEKLAALAIDCGT
jgi:hypothetical protein